ncbi:MAG: hypothetical protein JXM73_09365 [Anaerolineae bacterium]|nr:hypothetical protein [Anaerolineae bacterium]
MTDHLAPAHYDAELGFLEDVFREMGYDRVQLYERSEELPYSLLAVGLDPDSAGREQTLAVTFYPTEELESTMLLQYYVQLPFRLDAAGLQRVTGLLPYLNRRLVVGHLGIDEDAGAVHYRYVQALQVDELITRERIADVVAMVSFSPHLFGEIVEKVGSGAISLEEARAEVDAQYKAG